MKKPLLLFGLALATLWGCKPGTEATVAEDISKSMLQFNLTVDSNTSFPRMPAIMSFVHASHKGNWIMFSGRTNGFHGFGKNEGFPKRKANDSIFVYDFAASTLYSMKAPIYGGDTGNVFLCTNLASTPQNEYLYACGGYGVASDTDALANKTYSYFMRMNLDNAIAAVKIGDTTAFKKAIAWGQSEMVRATGGELFKLPDGNFYMALGHRFTGNYGNTSSSPNREKQEYVDKINVFKLEDGANGNLNLVPVSVITDGLPDSITQFRRRDLVVAPCIQANGLDVGLAVYGGVFTYVPGPGSIQNAGTPFHHPIYIDYKNQTTPYRVDSFSQWTNIYSAAFMSMFVNDGNLKCMTTTVFGGLGDSINNTNAFASANWTNVISTNARVYFDVTQHKEIDITGSFQNPTPLPGYIGTESIFIPDAGVALYNKNYKIIDYSKLTNGQTLGYIYGGIKSNICCTDSNGTTHASGKVYKVVINLASAAKSTK